MPMFTPKLAGGMAAAVALATAFTSAHAQTTALYSGGGTLAEKVYRDIFNKYGNNAGGDTCVGLPATYCTTTPYRSNVEALYVGVGSGNGKKGLVYYDPSLYVSSAKKPDNPPVASTRDFGPFYGAGTGASWVPGTGVGPFFPKVSFSGSDDPLNATDVSVYAAKFGPLIQVPGLVAAVAVAFTPSAGWNPQGKLLTGGSSKVNLSTNTICGIFTGAIKTWNNAEITKDNKNVPLGSGNIAVVYRHDGSGTTFLFTNALLNQCGTTTHPVSTHPVPNTWLTAAVQGTAITYSATVTPLNSHFTSNNNFFINVFNAGKLPLNFYNDKGGFSGVTGGANGSGGVQKVIDHVAGAIGYISPDFVQPITTGNDSNGSPVAATANIQSYYTYSNHLAAAYIPPSAAHANYIMQTAVPPSFTGGATAPANNPVNWGVVNPTPASANAYPFGGFTFLDLYSCYASLTDVDALAGITAGKLGLFRWYYGSSTENGGVPSTTLTANGFSAVPTAWLAAVKKLMFTSTYSRIGTPHKLNTACATVSNGA